MAEEQQLRREKMCTGWQMLIRHLLTLGGNPKRLGQEILDRG
jgi:hypothetical protein